ncbi:hypothetical protein [Nostoc sp. 106C]|uniref:hypothetical protein n=1 Tax=Nostoc sp. 106C TaxID=1932667 RepID=UPI0030DDBF45
MHREDLGWRTNGGTEASEVLRVPSGGLPAGAGDMRCLTASRKASTHITGVL